MDTNDKDRQQGKWLDEDHVVCVPDKDIQAIEHVIRSMEQTQQELHKIRDNMKPLDNEETASGDSRLKAGL